MSHKLSKSEAVAQFHREHPAARLSSAATHFANVNESKDVWWYDIPLSKIDSDSHAFLDLLAYDYRSGDLHCLHIPKAFLRENLSKLFVRSDKDTISLELSTNRSNLFQDVRPVGGKLRFSQFALD